MSEAARYDAVHLRYDDNNIRFGEGCKVEVVAAYDYDQLRSIVVGQRQSLDIVADRLEAMRLERDALRADNQRLEGEVARLRAALETVSAMFPAGITKQGFAINGQIVTADGDDEFLSCKKVEAWAAPLRSTIDAALRGNGG